VGGSISVYVPTKCIDIIPFGVSICMVMNRRPPRVTSISAVGMVAPSGPYQAAKCSASVHICHTRSMGAAMVRSTTADI
jgi:hypothetical protein